MLKSDLSLARAEAWKLTAPSLNATRNVTLGDVGIRNDDSWQPQKEPLPVYGNAVKIDLPAASGMLIFLH